MKLKLSWIFTAAIIVLFIGVLKMFSIKIQTRIDTNRITLRSIDDIPKEYWEKLAEKKIFFGHQSVGYNIVDGIKDIIKEHEQIKLNIVNTHNPTEFDRPIFAHSQVGRNADPPSKINSFRDIMDAGVGDKADIAFFKFCYVDIMRDSDPKEIFGYYRTAVENLQKQYSRTKFLHVTVPITSAPKGAKRNLKEYVKLLIGRPGFLDDNIIRQNYNTLLKQAYSQTDTVFDLALHESADADGSRCYTNKGAEKVFLMVPGYTEDGGHLNEQGRKKIAEQLLIFLARTANEP